MRRIAVSKVYTDRYHSYTNHIVELYGDHVAGHYPLPSELPMTEWLGGIIIMSRAEDVDLSHAHTIADILDTLEQADSTAPRPQAYHITGMDVQSDTLTAKTKIRILSESE